MSEATWDEAASPDVDWRMSAALENVPRGNEDLAEVTSLEGAVRTWLALDAEHRGGAVLTPERPVMLDGAAMDEFRGEGIATLAERLPGAATATPDDPDAAA